MNTRDTKCPACQAWTLEWSDEQGSCETCGYGGHSGFAGREKMDLQLLRRWRAELAEPYVGSRLERDAAYRQLRVQNCAWLADFCEVPRMGDEVDAPPIFPFTDVVQRANLQARAAFAARELGL